MMTRALIRPVSLGMILIAVAAISGCVKLEKPYPERHEYLLGVKRQGEPRANAYPESVLAVRSFRIAPEYSQKMFVIRRSDYRVDSNFYAQFFVQPDRNITDVATAWLDDCGLFNHVVPTSSLLDPTHLLEANVATIHGDAREQKAVMEIEFFLFDIRSMPAKVVSKGSYRETIPTDSKKAEALARSWDEALQKILTRFEEDLAAAAPPG